MSRVIALINPNTSEATTEAMVRIARQSGVPGVVIEGHTAPFGAPLITDPAALDRAAEAVLTLAPGLARADAVIVAAFGDPGLRPLRTALTVPVTGIAEAGMRAAAEGGRRFCVVTTTPHLRDRIAQTARDHGHYGFLGTWTTPGDPQLLMRDADALRQALAEACTDAIEDSGAEAIVIGGGPLAQAAQALAQTVPVPLIQPLPEAVRLSLARLQQGASP